MIIDDGFSSNTISISSAFLTCSFRVSQGLGNFRETFSCQELDQTLLLFFGASLLMIFLLG